MDSALLAKANLNFSGVSLANLYSEVEKSPPEIINIKQVVSFLVHSLVNSVESVDGEAASLVNALSEVSGECLNVKSRQFF